MGAQQDTVAFLRTEASDEVGGSHSLFGIPESERKCLDFDFICQSREGLHKIVQTAFISL